MSRSIPLQSPSWRNCTSRFEMRFVALLIAGLIAATFIAAQSPANPAASQNPTTTTPPKKPHHNAKTKASAKKPEPAAPVAPPPPPAPAWPVNDKPNPASVTWDSRGLRIEATNSSLQQILSEISTETGARVEGMGADQRVYGAYGPGQARDVLMQLLQGSGYNVLLAGDLGAGAPREIVLSLRRSGTNAPGAANRPAQDAGDEDVPDEVEEQPPPPPQPQPAPVRPGLGPGGPVRTPQQVMEEMQQRQQQQQQQQQANPQNPPQN